MKLGMDGFAIEIGLNPLSEMTLVRSEAKANGDWRRK